MARKRIHELAKEWGVETQQVLTQLEAQGTHGKKAQSTLSEQDANAVQQALRSPAAPPLVLGEEKVVAERVVTELDQQKEHVVTAREEIRENRIRPNVIRRRKRVEVLNDDTATWSESAPVAFSAPTVEEPLPTFAPVAFDAPVQQPAPFIPEPLSAETPAFDLPPESTDEPPQQEARGEVSGLSIPVSVEDGTAGAEEEQGLGEQEKPSTVTPSSDTPAGEQQVAVMAEAPTKGDTSEDAAPASEDARQENARSARVLGRIDLGKLAEPPVPRPAGFTRPASPSPFTADIGTREGTGGEGIGASGRKRGKKRKVIRNAESLDVQEREAHVARGSKRKRLLPGKEQRQTEITVPKASKRVVRISEVITVGDLAHSLGVKVGEVIKKLMGLGVMATINQILDHDTASLVAADFEYTVENVAFDAESVLKTSTKPQKMRARLSLGRRL